MTEEEKKTTNQPKKREKEGAGAEGTAYVA